MESNLYVNVMDDVIAFRTKIRENFLDMAWRKTFA